MTTRIQSAGTQRKHGYPRPQELPHPRTARNTRIAGHKSSDSQIPGMRGQGSSKAAEITILLYITALRSGTITKVTN